jgi:MerR family transcriptional regulator, light-induced transcriptional regulator
MPRRASEPAANLLHLHESSRNAAIAARLASNLPKPDIPPMSAVRTNAAAAMIGVSPSTLRSWERRFGFPQPRRTEGGHRQFDLQEIEALRSAFEETQNVSSAISIARERGAGPASPSRLRSALNRFDEAEADRIVEESLSVRSVERTVDEVVLPAIEALDDGTQPPPPEYNVAWRWATGWLAAQQRVAPPAFRTESVLVFDASRAPDVDGLYAQALDLGLRRAGLRTLTVTLDLDPSRITRAMLAVEPRAVVLTGTRASLDALGRLVYAARRAGGDVRVYDFRGALPETGASTVPRLPARPLAARDQLSGDLLQCPAATRVRRGAAALAEAV